ncbi:MAG: cupin domain-containing protein [Alphaproteobacteria bacterium]|nr:cupin domain-containing protein [Alphaproteobacteria bacterium]
MSRAQAEASVLVDDARVRVTRFDFAPGAETGWHRHGHDYVIVAVTDCAMRIEQPDGGVGQARFKAGESYRRDKGVEHNVINDGPETMRFVEVELK